MIRNGKSDVTKDAAGARRSNVGHLLRFAQLLAVPVFVLFITKCSCSLYIRMWMDDVCGGITQAAQHIYLISPEVNSRLAPSPRPQLVSGAISPLGDGHQPAAGSIFSIFDIKALTRAWDIGGAAWKRQRALDGGWDVFDPTSDAWSPSLPVVVLAHLCVATIAVDLWRRIRGTRVHASGIWNRLARIRARWLLAGAVLVHWVFNDPYSYVLSLTPALIWMAVVFGVIRIGWLGVSGGIPDVRFVSVWARICVGSAVASMGLPAAYLVCFLLWHALLHAQSLGMRTYAPWIHLEAPWKFGPLAAIGVAYLAFVLMICQRAFTMPSRIKKLTAPALAPSNSHEKCPSCLYPRVENIPRCPECGVTPASHPQYFIRWPFWPRWVRLGRFHVRSRTLILGAIVFLAFGPLWGGVWYWLLSWFT